MTFLRGSYEKWTPFCTCLSVLSQTKTLKTPQNVYSTHPNCIPRSHPRSCLPLACFGLLWPGDNDDGGDDDAGDDGGDNDDDDGGDDDNGAIR